MAKKTQNNKATVEVAKAEVQENNTMDVQAAAFDLVREFEMENAKAHETQRGQSLPMRDIIEGVDMLMDAAGATKASVRVLAEKVPKLLAVKYAAMGNSTNLVAVKVGHVIKEIPNDELRSLREKQLAHMQDPKTKDNFYRRIYNIGFRKEGKRFELDAGDLVRKKITEGDNPQV